MLHVSVIYSCTVGYNLGVENLFTTLQMFIRFQLVCTANQSHDQWWLHSRTLKLKIGSETRHWTPDKASYWGLRYSLPKNIGHGCVGIKNKIKTINHKYNAFFPKIFCNYIISEVISNFNISFYKYLLEDVNGELVDMLKFKKLPFLPIFSKINSTQLKAYFRRIQ